MGLRVAFAGALLLWAELTAGAGIAMAQEPADSPVQKDQVIQRLLERVEALEREVAALQGTPVPPAAPDPPAQTVSADNSPPDNTSRFNFHGYADADFQRDVDGDTKKFELGEIDLFATERLSSRLTALLEIAFLTDSEQLPNDIAVNVERMLLQYRQNDFFNVDIGAYRTAIGYYSTAYLRGAWLQTAISRPKMFTFEDQGGFLPLHAVGVSVNGRIPSGALNVHYVLEAGSSRNYGNTEGVASDISFNRATNAAVYSQPSGLHGLEIGFSSYHDLFSPVAGFALNRSVWMVHLVYVEGRIEFLNEGLRFNLGDSPSGSTTALGFYSQIAYRVSSSWKPYGRVEYLNMYGTGGVEAESRFYIPWKTVYTAGVRYDLAENTALKFEVGRETDYIRPAYVSAAVQLAFTF